MGLHDDTSSAMTSLELDSINTVGKSSSLSTTKDVELGKETCSTTVLEDDPVHGESHWAVGSAHIITAAIGAGVLSLPSTVAFCGWIGGVIALTAFGALGYLVSMMLARGVEHNGIRFKTYSDAVGGLCGARDAMLCAIVQYTYMVATTLAYTITPALSLQTIEMLLLPPEDEPHYPWFWAIIVGCCQLLLSQMPSLEAFWWGSALAAVMSIVYSSISVYLGIANWGTSPGSLGGVTCSTTSNKVFGIFNSIGSMMFAYSFSVVLLEIASTLRSPALKNTRKAVSLSNVALIGFYLLVAITNYGALGNSVQSDLLESYSQPKWLVVLANICVVLHLLPAYQVFAQPVYAASESKLTRAMQGSIIPKRRWFKLIWRSGYVAIITTLAALFPFFSAFIALIGAIQFWPLTVYWPLKIWRLLRQPGKVVTMLLNILSAVCLFLTLLALVGSVYNLVHSVDTFSIGGTRESYAQIQATGLTYVC